MGINGSNDNEKRGMKNSIIARIKASKEIKDYIIWGAIAAVVNVGTFRLLVLGGMDYKVANISALVINRFFCYFTNKFFVFKTKSKNFVSMIKEMVSFFLSRLVSFFIDYFGVIFLVEFMKMNETIGKIFIAFVVIMSNFFFSKFFVFKKNKDMEEQNEINNSDSML